MSVRTQVLRTHLILYVADQDAATAFWQQVLGAGATLHVPGMTDFAAGAAELSPVAPRSWGADVGYSLTPDALVLAFASC